LRGYDDEARERLIGYDLGLETDEPPILGSEDEMIIKQNMNFSIKINTICQKFGATKIEEGVIPKGRGCIMFSRVAEEDSLKLG
jgi:Xaa-Pro aminopeptidase